MLRIGDFSKLSRISIRMLRHYDEMGLLVPERVDQKNGFRYYSAAQLLIAGRIRALRQMGFSIAVTAEILETCKDAQSLARYLRVQQSELREKAEAIQIQARMLESAMKTIGKEDSFMNYSVVRKEMPRRYVASLRKIIPSYDKEGVLWQQMYQEVSKRGEKLLTANPCYSLAIFHDKGYKEQDVDVEIQIALDAEYEATENVCFKNG